MPNWYKDIPTPLRCTILLFERFSNHCLANVVEPLRGANMLARCQVFDWQFVTLDGQSVASSSGLPVLPRCALADAGKGDILFVMPSYDVRAHATPKCLRALRDAAGRHRRVAGMDTGSWLMARAGLLDGRRATIHWDEIDAFAEAFPEVEVLRRRYVIDGNRLTCGGAMTAFDLTSRLIGDWLGEGMRLEVASLFMFGDAHRAADPLGTRNRLVGTVVGIMRSHIEEPLPLPEVARLAGCAQREMEARFRAELGASPRAVYRKLRLGAAMRYAELTAYPISEIALRCGYRNASAMTRAFLAEFGTTPRAVRSVAEE